MTEEELATRLGMVQTPAMLALRPVITGLAHGEDGAGSPAFISALTRYQELGQALVEPDAASQIALILLTASLWRDIAAVAPGHRPDWADELRDAQHYAAAMGLAEVSKTIAAWLTGI